MTTSLLDEAMVTLPVACNRDCGGPCPLVATVKDGRVTRIAGNPAAGRYLKGCARGFQAWRQQQAPGRLTAPLVRSGPRGSGRFREASWDAGRATRRRWSRRRARAARRRRHPRAGRLGLVPRCRARHGGPHGAVPDLDRRPRPRRSTRTARQRQGHTQPVVLGTHRSGRRPCDPATLGDGRPLGRQPRRLHHGLRVAGARARGEAARRAYHRDRPAPYRDGQAARHRVAAGAAGHR